MLAIVPAKIKNIQQTIKTLKQLHLSLLTSRTSLISLRSIWISLLVGATVFPGTVYEGTCILKNEIKN